MAKWMWNSLLKTRTLLKTLFAFLPSNALKYHFSGTKGNQLLEQVLDWNGPQQQYKVKGLICSGALMLTLVYYNCFESFHLTIYSLFL